MNKNAYNKKTNILNQVLSAKSKKRIWIGDIIYIPTRHGWLHLAAFIDIFSRKAVGWAIDTRIRDTLVLFALNQAHVRQQPLAGLIIHTDCGSQYTAHRFQTICGRYNFIQSMSRKENP